ncbi:SPASM domain-containing protein [Enterobacter sp. UPMP2061]
MGDGISIKANVALHAENSEYFQETKEFLENIGVNIIHFDHVKKIGRVCNDNTTSELSELCGACWNGIICVAVNGDVSPCAMSKKIKVGSIIKESLSDIVNSELLALKRAEIKHSIWDKKRIDIKSPYDEVQADNKPSPKDEPPKPYCYPTCQPSTHCLPD